MGMKLSHLSCKAQSDSLLLYKTSHEVPLHSFHSAGAPGAVSNLYALMLMPGHSLWQEPAGALRVFMCQGVKSKFSLQNNSWFPMSVVG